MTKKEKKFKLKKIINRCKKLELSDDLIKLLEEELKLI